MSDPMCSPTPADPVRFAVVPLANFTLTAFAGFVDTLRLAADEGDGSRPLRCTWTILGESLAPVRASCGVEILPWATLAAALDQGQRFHYIVFVGGVLHQGRPVSAGMLQLMRLAESTGATLVGLCTGAFALYEAGVMAQHKVCVSWFHYWDFLHRFPHCNEKLLVADRLFVIDRRRITCSGGRSVIDVAAAILARHLNAAVLSKALRILQVDEPGRVTTPQPHPPGTLPSDHPRIRRAVLLMEQHLAGGLGIAELAAKLDLSPRQLERLFKTCTGKSPQDYARGLRLRAAGWMLAHTVQPVAEVALACGFADASHLGREFRKSAGQTPRAYREACRLRDAGEMADGPPRSMPAVMPPDGLRVCPPVRPDRRVPSALARPAA
jgi:transcriptional regulator GlxA family with amidase domain